MALQQCTLFFSGGINTSLQVRDIGYYSTISTVGGSGFSTSTKTSIKKFGIVNGIDRTANTVSFIFDDAIAVAPASGDYIMFEKDKRVNSSSLIGYYADVNFVNYSTKDIEMFSIGSQITTSSK